MNATCNYLDLAKQKLGVQSDYALAKALGLRTTAISNYRSGRNHFDDATAIKLAHAIGLQPAELLAAMQVERAKTEETRAAWADLLEKISKGFRTLALRANACGALVPQV
ncbi:helix-turn-helix domain-containing protein [Burkholderia cenocepacia]|nr:DUF3693 domain-containing protein [Burkholderia cenocepacia]MBR8137220.1 helix-turn-helix domain-containing protein [Burkholderia cenocepacia]